MLVAEELVREFEAGAVGVAERLSYVEESLVESGVDPRRPYLKPGSCDDYEPLPARWRAEFTPLVVHSEAGVLRGLTAIRLREKHLGISRRIRGKLRARRSGTRASATGWARYHRRVGARIGQRLSCAGARPVRWNERDRPIPGGTVVGGGR